MANEAPERIWAVKEDGRCYSCNWPVTGWTEYIRIDLATLSSDAVAGGEEVPPVFGWVLQEAVEFLQKGQRENNLSSTVVHSHPNEEMGWTAPLYTTPPETAQLLERVKELEKALDGLFSAERFSLHVGYQNGNYLYDDVIRVDDEAFRAARRVREGGKV